MKRDPQLIYATFFGRDVCTGFLSFILRSPSEAARHNATTTTKRNSHTRAPMTHHILRNSYLCVSMQNAQELAFLALDGASLFWVEACQQ